VEAIFGTLEGDRHPLNIVANAIIVQRRICATLMP
jgi:hypothetical protein